MDTSTKINEAIKAKGLKKKHIYTKMGITVTGFGLKLKANRFSNSELFYLQSLLDVDFDIKA